MNGPLEKNSSSVRKRIENHVFEDEEGDEYEGSEFNGFGDYFRRKKIKLQNLDAEIRASSNKPPIFKGIVAHVNGYTQPPLHVLHHDIVQHGGGFLQYLDSKTMATHIITANLTLKKAAEFSRYRIVKPAWIVDSIKAGKLLPWTDYRVITESPSQKVLMFGSSGGLTQTSPSPIKAESQSQLTSQLLDKSVLPSRRQAERSDDILPNASGLVASKPGDDMDYSANATDNSESKVELEAQLAPSSLNLEGQFKVIDATISVRKGVVKPEEDETTWLEKFYGAIISVGGIVQSVSVDEALVDATDIVLKAAESHGLGVEEGSLWKEQQKADEIALSLRNQIKEETGCAVSVGIGANILQAKVALRKAKPAGQFHLKPDQVLDIIGDLKVEQLPGVAYSIGGKLEDLGVKLVKDLRDVPKDRLVSLLGPKTSDKLHDYARGIDRSEVGEQPPRKSVSAEVNWGIRFISQAEAEEFVYNLCKELEKRLVNEHVKGKNLTMKIMRRALDAPLDPTKHLGHGKCDSFNKSASFGVATHDYQTIGKEAVSILRSFRFSPGDLRGIGVQMTKLEPIKVNPLAIEGSQRKIAFAPFVEPSPLQKQSRADLPDGMEGTQFLLPSSADPAVLAELPGDIRTKLMAQRPKAVAAESNIEARKSRSNSPMLADLLSSQVDLEVFDALPEDMKAEVLALYGRKPTEPPQPRPSPRKSEMTQSRRPTTPTKASGVRGLFSKAQRQRDAQEGMIQTNFRPPVLVEDAQPEEIEELDPEFLAELPEDD
ncbi:DNA repair protein REV1 [Trichoderma asperellum]|uniref:DNA repair protein REV1 n=1 Tax=Trichoderma asperellum TaxID=101201 RepID=A0A6V8R0K0_TRIAP|nr:DNA repair protein REV1 [Trichoderma asperellum]